MDIDGDGCVTTSEREVEIVVQLGRTRGIRQASQQLAEVENIIERGANQGDRIADRLRTDHESVVADAAVQRVVTAPAVQRVVSGPPHDPENGRTSCRERCCQYV